MRFLAIVSMLLAGSVFWLLGENHDTLARSMALVSAGCSMFIAIDALRYREKDR